VLHSDYVVEMVATKRQGKKAVDTLIEDGIETQRRWRVHVTDAKEPIVQYLHKRKTYGWQSAFMSDNCWYVSISLAISR
jgi:hypothetical protein